jgi:hypothetical protein
MTTLYYAQDISLGWPDHPAKNIWRHVERLGIKPTKHGNKYALNEAQVVQLEKAASITISRKKTEPAAKKSHVAACKGVPRRDAVHVPAPMLKQRKTAQGQPYLLAVPVTAVPKPWQWSKGI